MTVRLLYLLVGRGADVNMLSGKYGSFLQVACVSLSISNYNIYLLLECNVNIYT